MPKSDWKEPFLRLKEKLRPQFNEGEKLFHGILMSPFYEENEIKEVVKNQAAAYSEEPLALTIETPTEDCKFHAHYFYGDKTICRQLNRDLSGIHDWLLGIPKGLLPKFNLPRIRTGSSENLITWVSVVYFLAWEIDAPYLRAEVDFQSRLHELTSVPWAEFSWPQNCNPRPILIHEGNSNRQFEKFLETFSEPEKGSWCPDIIGAYLHGQPFCGNFIEASLAAVDVLVFMLEQIQSDKDVKKNKPSSSIKKKWKPKGRRHVDVDVIFLKKLLSQHHDSVTRGEKANFPLTAEQIAESLGWMSKSGKPLLSRVRRRMIEYLGPNAMKKYRSAFVGGRINPGFKRMLDDETYDIEAIDNSVEDKNSEENDFD